MPVRFQVKPQYSWQAVIDGIEGGAYTPL